MTSENLPIASTEVNVAAMTPQTLFADDSAENRAEDSRQLQLVLGTPHLSETERAWAQRRMKDDLNYGIEENMSVPGGATGLVIPDGSEAQLTAENANYKTRSIHSRWQLEGSSCSEEGSKEEESVVHTIPDDAPPLPDITTKFDNRENLPLGRRLLTDKHGDEKAPSEISSANADHTTILSQRSIVDSSTNVSSEEFERDHNSMEKKTAKPRSFVAAGKILNKDHEMAHVNAIDIDETVTIDRKSEIRSSRSIKPASGLSQADLDAKRAARRPSGGARRKLSIPGSMSPDQHTSVRMSQRAKANAHHIAADSGNGFEQHSLSPNDRAAKRLAHRGTISAPTSIAQIGREVANQQHSLSPMKLSPKSPHLSPRHRATIRRTHRESTVKNHLAPTDDDADHTLTLTPNRYSDQVNNRNNLPSGYEAIDNEQGSKYSPVPGAYSVRSNNTSRRGFGAQQFFSDDSLEAQASIVAVDRTMERSMDSVADEAHDATLAPSSMPSPHTVALQVEKVNDNSDGSSRRSCIIISSITAVILVVVVVVVSVLLTRGNRDGDDSATSPPILVRREYNASRLPALVSRLEQSGLPFLLNSTASEFALDWIANVDDAVLELEEVDDTRLLQRFALAALYNATNGEGWQDQCQFLSELSVCDWRCEGGDLTGIFCNEGVVESLILVSNDLIGSLPQEIRALSTLRAINLHDNKLQGAISSNIGSFTALTYLVLSSNDLESIDAGIGKLTNLLEINLALSGVGGSLPTEIGMLGVLSSLNLSGSKLRGTLPTEIGLMRGLQTLKATITNINGDIPSEIGYLSNLRAVEIAATRLSGELPTELGKLASATSIDFKNNRLKGQVPSEIGRLSLLTYLGVAGNDLGEIPSEVSLLTNLKIE